MWLGLRQKRMAITLTPPQTLTLNLQSIAISLKFNLVLVTHVAPPFAVPSFDEHSPHLHDNN